jgi:hypothetical protein
MRTLFLMALVLSFVLLFAVGCQQQPQTGKGWFDKPKMSYDIPQYEPPTYKQPKHPSYYPSYTTPTTSSQQMCCKVGMYYLGGNPTLEECREKGGTPVSCAYCCNIRGNVIEASASECLQSGGSMVTCPFMADYPQPVQPPEETKPVSDTYKRSPVTQQTPPTAPQMCCKVGMYYLGGNPTYQQCTSTGGTLVSCAYCCNVGGNILEASAYECRMKGGYMTACPYAAG